MPSFGEKLKQEREKRKISLEQISASTKIGTRMLQALEEDKFNQLPGGIFNKGFVRAYSRCLGLDEDQTVAEYLQASGDAPPVSTEIAARDDGARENAENISRLEAISDAHPRQLPWGLFAAILVLIALSLVFWSRRREHERQLSHPAPNAAVPASTAAQPSADSSGKASSNDSASSPSTAASQTTGSPSTTSPTTGSPSNSTPARGSAAAKTPQSVSVPAAAPGEFTVVIRAREESWVSVTADGKTAPAELLSAGSERVLHGRQKIVVKTGNAGGIDFRFNGKKLDAGGEFGEVRTVTFGPDGMVPAAPAPPSTP